jgi:ABC-type multidrug transport system fused ATPase/permease subunit
MHADHLFVAAKLAASAALLAWGWILASTAVLYVGAICAALTAAIIFARTLSSLSIVQELWRRNVSDPIDARQRRTIRHVLDEWAAEHRIIERLDSREED